MVQAKIKKIIILGGTGSGISLYSIIKDINKEKKQYEFIGFLEDNKTKVLKQFKKLILGKFKDVKKFKGHYFAISIGNEKNFLQKKNIIKNLKIKRKYFPNLIHPTAIVSNDLKLGYGNIIYPYVNIDYNSNIGNFNTFLTKTLVSHDVTIKNYNIFNSSILIGGNVMIKNCCYFGQGSNIRDHISIDSKNLIGMGSVLTKSLKGSNIFYNNHKISKTKFNNIN